MAIPDIEQFSFIWAKKCWRKGRIILESVYFCVFCFQYEKSLLQINNYNEQFKFGFPFANLLRSKTRNCSFAAQNSLGLCANVFKKKLFVETLVQINKTILVYLIHTYLLDQTNILLALPSLLMRLPLDYGYSPFNQIVIDCHHSSF